MKLHQSMMDASAIVIDRKLSETNLNYELLKLLNISIK